MHACQYLKVKFCGSEELINRPCTCGFQMLIAKQVSGKSTSNNTTTIGLENKIQHFVFHMRLHILE
jgi:hypothetical protein